MKNGKRIFIVTLSVAMAALSGMPSASATPELPVAKFPEANVASGDSFTVQLKPDGTVWTWGCNKYGQLGDGTIQDRTYTAMVNGLKDVVSVAAGMSHTVALKSDGTVWTWGYNKNGQLGDGSVNDKYVPVQVSGLTGVVSVAAGHNHTLAVKSDGTVWAWGYNKYGQLGDGTTKDRSTPAQVKNLSGVVSIAAYDDTLALISDGTVWAWGYNRFGQLGDGTTKDKPVPAQIPGLNNVKCIAAGNDTVIVKSDGTVWDWGCNKYGQLGDGSAKDKSVPTLVSGITGVVSNAAGNHTIAVQSDGTVLAWGNNDYGQLGNGAKTNQSLPINITDTAEPVNPGGSGKTNPNNSNKNTLAQVTALACGEKTDASVSLTWDPVSWASGYVVNCSGVSYSSQTNAFKITGLIPNTAYTIQVRAVNGAVQGPLSLALSVTTNPVKPDVQPPPASRCVEYKYDANGRLVEAVYSDGSKLTYTYDAAGNITGKKIEKLGGK